MGLRFRNTRLLGAGIPLHRRFDEVNLRFYVRRRANDGWHRATVFIKEIVARPAIAVIARLTYNEPYVALPMRSAVDKGRVAYAWRRRGRWEHIEAFARGEPVLPAAGSFEAYVAERSHGYTRQRTGATLEYHVAHPRWRIAPAEHYGFDADVGSLYGERFVSALARPPRAVFIAEGSPVTIEAGVIIEGTNGT